MRILIHGLNFAPELVGVGKFTGEMAEWLAESGHDVRAVTAPPFNPASRVAPGYSSWLYRRENRVYHRAADVSGQGWIQCESGCVEASHALPTGSGTASATAEGGLLVSEAGSRSETRPVGRLSIFRCPLWVPRTPSAGKRALHLASFAVSSFWSMLLQVPWRPQVVLVIEPTLFCAPSAWLTARWSGAKTWFHIQDFEADAAFELGLLSSSQLRRLVCALEKKCMQSFDRVSTISEKMWLRLAQKGLEPSRCLVFPNWVDTSAIFPLPNSNPLRAELGIPRDAVVALYSGTMAQKQGLDMLAGVARTLSSSSEIQFVFCGDGPAKPILANLAAQMKNVRLLPLQPSNRLNELLNLADIHLLPQRANAADLVMPSKLTGMLASGRPVVASAPSGTQLAEVVDGRGIVVPPENGAAFAEAIDQLASCAGLREELGRNARAYAVSNLEKNTVLRRFEHELLKLVSGMSEEPALSS
ncbi:MAG TPA: glycosyltransferase WbuB [Terriglobales bacterium]|nr:glycosyltransferase WbuB [Terriglobales bacterium]